MIQASEEMCALEAERALEERCVEDKQREIDSESHWAALEAYPW